MTRLIIACYVYYIYTRPLDGGNERRDDPREQIQYCVYGYVVWL